MKPGFRSPKARLGDPPDPGTEASNCRGASLIRSEVPSTMTRTTWRTGHGGGGAFARYKRRCTAEHVTIYDVFSLAFSLSGLRLFTKSCPLQGAKVVTAPPPPKVDQAGEVLGISHAQKAS